MGVLIIVGTVGSAALWAIAAFGLRAVMALRWVAGVFLPVVIVWVVTGWRFAHPDYPIPDFHERAAGMLLAVVFGGAIGVLAALPAICVTFALESTFGYRAR